MPALIPYGKLSSGKYGLHIDDVTNDPLSAAVEIVDNLPAVADPDNFEGRVVFDRTTAVLYVFSTTPSNRWVNLEGIPAEVDGVEGEPPTSPTPQTGSFFYDTDTEVVFVYDGSQWQAVGGRFSSKIVEQTYVGDGSETSFPIGTTEPLQPQYVEVFLDGVRQWANPGGDFNLVGTNVEFPNPVENGVQVRIRATVGDGIIQSAQGFEAVYIANAGEIEFSVGASSVGPEGVLVFVNGELQARGVDYTYHQVDTTIDSISRINSTTARVTTEEDHALGVGFPVKISGAAETAYHNQSYDVTNVPSATEFDITIDPADPNNATPDPVLYYLPSYQNDIIEFTASLSGSERVVIKSFRSLILAPTGGEANVLGTLGSGTSLVAGKSEEVLQLKSLVAGANVNITDDTEEVTFSVDSVGSFENYNGINSSQYTLTGDISYIGVRSTTDPVEIDLSGMEGGGNTGRKITVVDETGGASANNISLTTNNAQIDGSSNDYVINTNYGAVTLVMDGNHWFVVSEKT